MKEISDILRDEEMSEHKMSLHYIEGQILAIIQRHDAKRRVLVK
jgi:isochorismate hydrolase